MNSFHIFFQSTTFFFFFCIESSLPPFCQGIPCVLSPYLIRSLLTWTQHLSFVPNHFLKQVRIGDIKHSRNKRKTHSSLFSFPIVKEIGFLNVQIDIRYVGIHYWKFSLLAFRYVVTTDLSIASSLQTTYFPSHR